MIKLLKHGVDSLSKINEEKSSLDLALYCDYWLRQVENEQYNLEETSESGARFSLKQIDLIKLEYPMLIVKQLLNAIKFNSYEARQRFPRLLQIVELYNEQTLDPFIKSVSLFNFKSYAIYFNLFKKKERKCTMLDVFKLAKPNDCYFR